jgi:hypothetical protein
VQLSLSNPHQQQAPTGISSASAAGQPPSAKRTALQMSHSNSCGRNNAAGGSGGSLGGMSKSMSMRTFG